MNPYGTGDFLPLDFEDFFLGTDTDLDLLLANERVLEADLDLVFFSSLSSLLSLFLLVSPLSDLFSDSGISFSTSKFGLLALLKFI